MATIDLNCDLGESFGAYTIGADEAVMPSITSANVACGFHAGDPGVMRRTVRLAREAGVAVGAHPGFPDLVGIRPPRDARDAAGSRGHGALSDRRACGDRRRRRACSCST